MLINSFFFYFKYLLDFYIHINSHIQIIRTSETPNASEKMLSGGGLIRLEHRFTMSDLEELMNAFKAS